MSDVTPQGPGDFTTPARWGTTAQAPQASPPRLDGPRRSDGIERRPRVWPALLIVAALWLAVLLPTWVTVPPMVQFFALFWGPMAATLALFIWWASASRVRWVDRVVILLACAVIMGATAVAAHESFRMGLVLYGLRLLVTAWVGWLLLTPFLSWPVRRAGLVVVFLLVGGACAAARMDGVDGNFSPELSLRWSQTEEEKSLAAIAARQATRPAPDDAAGGTPVAVGAGDWTGFRGPGRDGRLAGVRIATDWDAHPPRELWRQRVGPGWSSFAVIGDRLYTQEQRGQAEAVVCYDARTGEQRWIHEDKARFTEPVAGAGPRATPTFHEGKIYTLGGEGDLNCLDAATGRRVWAKNVKDDSGASLPQWGFSASPLVARGVVSVYAGGPDGKAVLGYRADTGKLEWAAGTGGHSYCSTQLSRLGGIEVLLVATEFGLTALDPAAGTVLREVAWPMDKGMARVVQPAVVGDTDVLIGSGFGKGTRRVKLTTSPSGPWGAEEEVWTTKAISPYYNDLVVHDGHLYGFDGAFFTCVSLDDGESRWRQRGYGNGQVLLLADQGLLVVLAETGEVALVEASPEKHTRLGKIKALKDKTWNHPVIAGGKLFVRNGVEMACYQLSEAKK